MRCRIAVVAGALLLGLLTAGEGRAQEPRTLRYGFQPGDVYHYDVEFGMTFVAGDTRNSELIRGIETLVVIERDRDMITLLPVASGLRVAELSIHGEDLEAFANRHRRWTEPFFGSGLLFENPPGVPGHVFLGKLVARFDDTGRATVESMVPRFWSLLIPIGEWLQNFTTAASYPWPVLPLDDVTPGEAWDLTFPGWADTFRFSYAGPDTVGAVSCDLVRGALKVSPEISSGWGATEGVDVRTALCLAHDGVPIREEFQASQALGEGANEQWIRSELIARHRLDDRALETVRQAADTAFPAIGEGDPEALQELVGVPAPPLELRGPGGATRDLSVPTARITVAHFWAPWSGQSSQTLAALLALRSEEDGGEVAVVPIAMEDEASHLLGLADVVLASMDSTAVTYRPAIEGLAAYRANAAMPVTVILDERGIVRKAYTGYVGRSELREAIAELRLNP